MVITILELAQNSALESPFHFNALHSNVGTSESFCSQLLLNSCFQNFTVTTGATVFYSCSKWEKWSSHFFNDVHSLSSESEEL